MKAIGVDLGGTWIRTALIGRGRDAGDILRLPTQRNRPPDVIIGDIVSLIRRLEGSTRGEIVGIGLGVPTTFDQDGHLTPCLNLPTMGGFPFIDALRKYIDYPIFMENDAQCFALGEWYYGIGKDAGVLVGITLGTGLGLGIVIDGKLLRGAHGNAGEIWCSPANIATEDSGNIESFASGTAIEELYERQTGRRLAAHEIAQLVEQGDEMARTVFEGFGTSLKNILFWIINMLDPDVIVLGGSVSESLAYIEKDIASVMKSREVTVVTSALGELAALYGAASLVFSHLELK
jgi:predicted NBD/HSP70 family sugar kinase